MAYLLTARRFPCPICSMPQDVRGSKQGKPYITCNTCGVQVFVRGKLGIAAVERLLDRARTEGPFARMDEMTRRYRVRCGTCGTEFWIEPPLIVTSMFDGSLKAFDARTRDARRFFPGRQARSLKGRRIVCDRKGTPLSQKEVQVIMRRVGRKANVKPGVHILRHTFCSHLAMRGAPAKAIQELAGHQDLATTQQYMHLSPAALDAAIRLLDAGTQTSSRGNNLEAAGVEPVEARPKADADLPGYTANEQRAYAVGLRRFRRPALGTASCPFQSRHITGDQRFFLCSCPTLQLPFTRTCALDCCELFGEHEDGWPPCGGVLRPRSLEVFHESGVEVASRADVIAAVSALQDVAEGHRTTMASSIASIKALRLALS